MVLINFVAGKLKIGLSLTRTRTLTLIRDLIVIVAGRIEAWFVYKNGELGESLRLG